MPAGETPFLVFTNSTSAGEPGIVALRDRAARLLSQIARLAPAVDLPDEHCVLAERLSINVSEPFLVVVVGEVNSGKSTLVNALLGGMFAPSGLLPVTDRVCVFQYGETPDDVTEHGMTTITRPLDVLKQLTIVDTPGVNSIESDHEQITDQFLPRADLALFVFNATNPWGAAGWEFLMRMSDVWLKDAVIVLSHSDLVATEDLKRIMERLEEETAVRFGAALPMFPVCASEAVGVRRMDGVITDLAMWRATGMERFDRFLQQSVGGNIALLKLLNTVVPTLRITCLPARVTCWN
jgi:tRNA U34 5-carboxymethylaminomethyl modifying GTPase MnmE/TrmE